MVQVRFLDRLRRFEFHVLQVGPIPLGQLRRRGFAALPFLPPLGLVVVLALAAVPHLLDGGAGAVEGAVAPLQNRLDARTA
ncbi:hypothetical protein GCM10009416_14360 [Craurococcus roseus]|uniref:Uncharacterized protein n=1 Tax=Craurococcus roseus TaxID=77585 RepID=A0ABP3PVW4_9PROT